MNQGEPIEQTGDEQSDSAKSAPDTSAIRALSRPEPEETPDTAENLAHTIETLPEDDKDDADDLDADVQNLLNALASEEFRHDEDWLEASRREDESKQPDSRNDFEPETADIPDEALPEFDPATAAIKSVAEVPAPVIDPETVAEKRQETDDLIEDALSAATSDIDEEEDNVATEKLALAADAVGKEHIDEQAANLLGLQAINVLNEKIAASEARYDIALTKMGHALGVIAQRIDGLEARMTDRTIANVALAAAPPDEDDDDDGSVAPYIARAERELKARKESGSMDIFDRIARAAENEFDDQTASTGTRILENSSDGRRVGTKRWQPSKTVKKRMEKLEKASNGNKPDRPPETEQKQPAARKLRMNIDPVEEADPVTQPEEPRKTRARAEPEAAPAPVLDLEEEEDDDESGLSVVPGARGRRRNRARKSRLDEDFEDVFAEEEGKPSIQSLRRKMRDRPADDEETEAAGKSSMLSGLLGKKSAKKSGTVPVEEEGDEDEDLLAAFDAPDEVVGKAKKTKGKRRKVVIEEDEDDDDDWDDKEDGAEAKRRPLLYALIAAAAAAGFYAYQTFLG